MADKMCSECADDDDEDCFAAGSRSPRKRVRFSAEDDNKQQISGSGSPANNRRSAASGNVLPRFTSSWLKQPNVNIIPEYREDVTPSELLDMFQPLYVKDNILCNQIRTIEKFFNQSDCPSFHSYLDHIFNSLTVANAKKMCKRNQYEIDFEDIKSLGPTAITWFQRFTECGKRFGEILYNLALRKEFAGNSSVRDLTEYDFQCLFQEFASMFGLHTRWSAPILNNRVLQTSQGEISGKADILYCQPVDHNPCKSLEKQMNIVAVCEVKNSSRTPRPSTSTDTSSSHCTCSDKRSKLPPHIPSDLLGKHGTNLLLYYPQSAKQDVIFGMIIQETEVTFTALNMTKDQYSDIVTGNKPTKSRLILTKAYDFMKKDDRKLLIRAFLELSMMQKHDWN